MDRILMAVGLDWPGFVSGSGSEVDVGGGSS